MRHKRNECSINSWYLQERGIWNLQLSLTLRHCLQWFDVTFRINAVTDTIFNRRTSSVVRTSTLIFNLSLENSEFGSCYNRFSCVSNCCDLCWSKYFISYILRFSYQILLCEKAFRILLRPIREAKRISRTWKNRFTSLISRSKIRNAFFTQQNLMRKSQNV